MIDLSRTNVKHVFLRHVSLDMLCREVKWGLLGDKHTHVSAFLGIIFVRKVFLEEIPVHVSPGLSGSPT